VYINRDLSSTAAKLVYDRREKRRRRQSTSARANVEQPVNTATLTLTNTQQIWNMEHYKHSKSSTCTSGHSISPSADPHNSVSVLCTSHTFGRDFTPIVDPDPVNTPFRSADTS